MMDLRTIDTHHAPVQVLTDGAGEDLVFLHGAPAGLQPRTHSSLLSPSAGVSMHRCCLATASPPKPPVCATCST